MMALWAWKGLAVVNRVSMFATQLAGRTYEYNLWKSQNALPRDKVALSRFNTKGRARSAE